MPEPFAAENLRNALQKHGLKLTHQRQLIYKELSRAKDHPNAEVLLRRVRKLLPTVSFDTVNRTLLTFADVGLARILEGKGDPKRFDPETAGHHHFRCLTCDRIFDFSNKDYYAGLDLPEVRKKGFTVLHKRVVLEGLCDICGKKRNS